MKNNHRETIGRIKDWLKNYEQFEILNNERFFETEIKGETKGSAWGYTPDLVIKTENNKIIVIEIEYGVSLAKVIEDVVLSNIVENVSQLIIITCYKDYVEKWLKLLKRNYHALTNFDVGIIECKNIAEDNETLIKELKKYLNV